MRIVVCVKNRYQRNRCAVTEELRTMSEEIRLERTEIGGYVTLIPQGRVMYTIAEYKRLQDDRDRWRDLCKLFDDHYICEECSAQGAICLQKCENPLHAIQRAVYELDDEIQ